MRHPSLWLRIPTLWRFLSESEALGINNYCNNLGYECCGRKEGRNNRKEYHSISRARKVRSEIVALYCNILKVS